VEILRDRRGRVSRGYPKVIWQLDYWVLATFLLLFGKEPIIPLDLLLTQHARPKGGVGMQYSRFVDDWESRRGVPVM